MTGLQNERIEMSAYVVFVRDRITGRIQDVWTDGGTSCKGRTRNEGSRLLQTVRTLEGPAVDGSVIIEFQTMDAAQAWYDSPLYQDAEFYRLKGASMSLSWKVFRHQERNS